MKSQFRILFCVTLSSLFVLVDLGIAAVAKSPTSKTKTSADTNSPPVEMPIPKSQFSASESTRGKDPFFPASARFQPPVAVATNASSSKVIPLPEPEVKLGGFSGSASEPLVIINNVTFGVGDEQMVISGNSRLRVRCLEIDAAEQMAVIEVNGKRRELRFRPKK